MSKGLKIFLWFLLIVAVIAIIGFILWKVWLERKFTQIWDNIIFSKPYPEGLDLQGLTLVDLQNIVATGQPKTITLSLGMDIENRNNFSIPFSTKIRSSYLGTPIAETNKISGTVPANGNFHVSAPITITLSGAQVQILIEKLQGKKVPIDYSIDLSLFGIPLNRFGYTITDKYEL